MIETRLLQYFLAVAEEQSITKAAEYLHISQPTLSKQMMDLEESLGKQLLICGEHRSTFSIMQIIRSIQEEYPDIQFHFFSSNADAITERLDKGLLDMGILLEPEISPRYDYQKLQLRETWGILMRKDSPLANKKEVTFSELTDLPLIMPSQTSNRNHLTAFLSDAMPEPHIVSTYNLIYNAGLMVEAGIGYALCIDGLINTSGNHPLIFRPLSPFIQSEVYLFTKKYQVFSKAAKLFLNRLEANIGRL